MSFSHNFLRSGLALVCLSIAPAAGGETWLTASIASYHFEHKDYCEVNPGAGFEHDIAGSMRFVAGTFQNSHCRASNYVGASWRALEVATRAGTLGAGVALIAVSGYGSEEKGKRDRIIVAPLPTLAWERGRFGANVVLLPPHESFKGGLGFQLKVRLP